MCVMVCACLYVCVRESVSERLRVSVFLCVCM